MNRMDMVCVPLYDTLGEPAVQYIIKHAETRFVLSSGAKLAMLARAVAKAEGVVSCGIAYWGEAPAETVKVWGRGLRAGSSPPPQSRCGGGG